MDDSKALGTLAQILETSYPKLSPQIAPEEHHSKTILRAIQSGILKSSISQPSQCEWCGKAIINSALKEASEGTDATTVDSRVLTWQMDFARNVVKITGIKFSCEDCKLLLDLKKLLTFLKTHDAGVDDAKLYSLASHMCQLNEHFSESGEDDLRQLVQATCIASSLHVYTKLLTGTIVLGPNGETITSESVDEAVKSLLHGKTGVLSEHQSPNTKSPTKRKKSGEKITDVKETPTCSGTLNSEKSSTEKKRKGCVIQSDEKEDESKEDRHQTPKGSELKKQRKSTS